LADFSNGVILFCSSELSEVMQPARPLQRRSYACGPGFDTATVQEALTIRRTLTYGVIAVDGDEATLGIVQTGASHARAGAAVTRMAHLSSNIASRTRRGGQSAARFGRNRDGEELAFLRKVAAKAAELLGDVRGLIVGGRADMKHKLLPELPLALRTRVACLINLGCSAGSEGLQAVAAHHAEVLERDTRREVVDVVSRFLEMAARTEAHAAPSVCYGEPQTMAAVRLGAVDQLLVSREALEHGCIGRRDWRVLAAAFGATVVEVDVDSDVGFRFCEGFRVGACLRYPLDPDLLEEEEELFDHEPLAEELSSRKPPSAPVEVVESDGDTVSTATPRSGTVLLRWLEEALKRSLGDDAAAESLTMCVDVLLFDGAAAINEECIDSAVDMLRDEGVPDDVLVELACHAADLVDESR